MGVSGAGQGDEDGRQVDGRPGRPGVRKVVPEGVVEDGRSGGREVSGCEAEHARGHQPDGGEPQAGGPLVPGLLQRGRGEGHPDRQNGEGEGREPGRGGLGQAGIPAGQSDPHPGLEYLLQPEHDGQGGEGQIRPVLDDGGREGEPPTGRSETAIQTLVSAERFTRVLSREGMVRPPPRPMPLFVVGRPLG